MEYISVKELAALKGCSERYIQALISKEKLSAIVDTSAGIRRYQIPVSALEQPLLRKWYRQHGKEPPIKDSAPKQPAPPPKPLEQYNKTEREQIAYWIHILEGWEDFRTNRPELTKAQADAEYIIYCGNPCSLKTLYRKKAAYEIKNWDGLVDKRGKNRKGKTTFKSEVRDLFEYFYLDERALSVAKCYEAMKLFILEKHPDWDIVSIMPSYDTVRRWAMEMPTPVATLARQGDKAFNDKHGIYINRLYDDMMSNDFWIADGHRIDVVTRSEDGAETLHRLTLSAFIDARSGIYVGWVVTDNPSSDATMLALRKAIQRYGIPKYLYVDNGREYLNIDIGGMGHRTRKKKVEVKLPTPILTRLGITMVNALPANGQAKTIEREFRNFTFLSRLFETYCGSNVVAKPEKLKHKLKNGNIPTDGELTQVVEEMIEGYFNHQPYNGKVLKDKGKSKLQVYEEQLSTVRRAAEEDLHLMMMRTTRLQKVGRNGVYILIRGEKLYYFDDDLQLMQGKKVFVRYDPEDMREVRIYDENESFIKTVAPRTDIELTYIASKADLSNAMSVKRKWHKLAKEEAEIRREKVVSQYGHINILDVYRRAARINCEGHIVSSEAKVFEIVRANEKMGYLSKTGTDGKNVVIDRKKIIQNNER